MKTVKWLAFVVLAGITRLTAADPSVHVIDIRAGDTLQVSTGEGTMLVQLYGIACPTGPQASAAARLFTAALVDGKNVILKRRSAAAGILVASVSLADGRNLNDELVRAGMAWWHWRNAPTASHLAELASDARNAGRGLWSEGQPLPPWESAETQTLRAPFNTAALMHRNPINSRR